MKIPIGFSPCPNDTFIFDALVNRKIDTGHLRFEAIFEDVQTLNKLALQHALPVSKISYGVLPLVTSNYNLLSSGGALGKGVGPLLISKRKIEPSEINDLQVAIPGENTTAHLLFSLAFPAAVNKKFMIFSEIENAILNEKVDAGVIIHENRFTYQAKGLLLVKELGEFWEKEMGCPIPLGGIVVSKKMDIPLQQKLASLIKSGIEYAFANYPRLPDYVKEHSQEMEETVMRQHIELYVNNFSLSLGSEGKKAVEKLMEVYESVYPLQGKPELLFIG